jgi:hypothetical protein
VNVIKKLIEEERKKFADDETRKMIVLIDMHIEKLKKRIKELEAIKLAYMPKIYLECEAT